MRNARIGACFFLTVALAGCAHLEFKEFNQKEPGLTYFEPVPYLAVTKGADCKMTVAVLSLPGEKRTLFFRSGYGTADLSATLSNGMLQSVGQKTDTKVPETLTAVAGLAKTAAGFAAAAPAADCTKTSYIKLYPIVGGVIKIGEAVDIPDVH
jgi:hypothetical protein